MDYKARYEKNILYPKMKWAIYIEVQVGKFGKAGWNAVQAQGVIIRLEKYGINIIQK